MRINAEAVRVDGPHGPLLRETSLTVGDGEVALVAGEPGDGHSALALVLSGRLEPSSGDVLLDNELNSAGLRACVAPIDVPGVSAPESGLVLSHVVAEELVMAHQPARRSAVKAWLEARDAGAYVDSEIGMLPASTRVRILTDLAAARRGVRALVLTSPDRHGGRPEFWWRTARAYAAEGFAVVVLCTESSARHLGVEPHHLGRPEPLPPLEIELPDVPVVSAQPAAEPLVAEEAVAEEAVAEELVDVAMTTAVVAEPESQVETARPAPVMRDVEPVDSIADDDGPNLSPIELQKWRAARARANGAGSTSPADSVSEFADTNGTGVEPEPVRSSTSASGVK